MSAPFHITQCPVCSSTDFKTVVTCQDWLVTQESFAILDCTSCSFRFTQDAPSLEAIGSYYDDVGYVEHSDTQQGLVFKLYHYGRMLMLRSKRNMIKRLNGGKRLLDIGSASGYFLDHMKQHGYEVNGVEISEKARQLCKDKFDIEVYTPDVLLDGGLDKKFDLITLWHVFEHVYTYEEYFKAFDQLLDDKGVLMIAMPNYQSFDASYYGKYWNGYDVPRHLWHFDPASFTRFAADRGFKVKQYHSMPLDPFYNSMVSADYKPNAAFLPWTLMIGSWAYLTGVFNKRKASSLVYVLSRD